MPLMPSPLNCKYASAITHYHSTDFKSVDRYWNEGEFSHKIIVLILHHLQKKLSLLLWEQSEFFVILFSIFFLIKNNSILDTHNIDLKVIRCTYGSRNIFFHDNAVWELDVRSH